MNKEPRLRFTDEERSDPALEKPIRKAEKAAARADKAQANIPKKKVRQGQSIRLVRSVQLIRVNVRAKHRNLRQKHRNRKKRSLPD